jgi:hypothetical protein
MVGFTLVELVLAAGEEDALLFASVGSTVVYTGTWSAWPKVLEKQGDYTCHYR